MNPREDHSRPTTPLRVAAVSVVQRLQSAGHQALFAGGCVRDMLMGVEPSDYDIATSAEPTEVLHVFPRGRSVGAKFGVILVRAGGHDFEVATFRRDIDYQDGRHPEQVQFTDAREDALRRDFTINGMFYDPLGDAVIDHVGGKEDLDARIIRAIGDPGRRFEEDHLRMLRAARFAARFGFAIAPETQGAIRERAAEISQISAERILVELELMWTHPSRAVGFRWLVDLALLVHLWPRAEVVTGDAKQVERRLAALPRQAGVTAALAAVLLPLGGRGARAACDALRCSNDTRRDVCWMLENLARLNAPDQLSLADLKKLMAGPAFGELMALHAAWLHSCDLPAAPHDAVACRAAAIPLDEISPPPLLTGHDLIALGATPGPRFRRVLDRAYDQQLDGVLMTRDQALDFARHELGERGR